MMKLLYALVLLGSGGWFVYAESAGDPAGYFAAMQPPLWGNPLVVLLGSVALVGVLLLFGGLFSGKCRAAGGAEEAAKSSSHEEILKGDLADLTSEKRRLEDELLKVSEREESAVRKVKDLETALEDATKKLKKTKNASARSEQVEAELCNFLGILQQKGRLVDFLMQDVAGYSNEQVGAAARVVHQGCSEAVKEYFQISPVHNGKEGEAVSLDGAYDPLRYKLLGSPPEEPPYQGKLLHAGWKTDKVTLPRVVRGESTSQSADVIAPAEVEVRAA